jgi:hypothetical protein
MRIGGWALGMYGIFSRVETHIQTAELALQQVKSCEIWGRVSRFGLHPCVKAYAGPLSNSKRGIEFTTSLAPEPDQGPLHVNWYYPRTLGVTVKQQGGEDFACIDANVTNKQP